MASKSPTLPSVTSAEPTMPLSVAELEELFLPLQNAVTSLKCFDALSIEIWNAIMSRVPPAADIGYMAEPTSRHRDAGSRGGRAPLGPTDRLCLFASEKYGPCTAFLLGLYNASTQVDEELSVMASSSGPSKPTHQQIAGLPPFKIGRGTWAGFTNWLLDIEKQEGSLEAARSMLSTMLQKKEAMLKEINVQMDAAAAAEREDPSRRPPPVSRPMTDFLSELPMNTLEEDRQALRDMDG